MSVYAREKRAAFRLWLAEQKTACVLCGESDHRCLVFHHRPGTDKRFQVMLNAWSRDRQSVLDEIAKCDCLCANCHQKLHYNRST
jgi:hypothetical protein